MQGKVELRESHRVLTKQDPVAIWAYLDPILEMVKRHNPDVQHLHFFSDGPATQYRQKGNFFMIAHVTVCKMSLLEQFRL